MSVEVEESALALGERLRRFEIALITQLHNIMADAGEEDGLVVLMAMGNTIVDFGYQLIGEEKMCSFLEELRKNTQRLSESERNASQVQ